MSMVPWLSRLPLKVRAPPVPALVLQLPGVVQMPPAAFVQEAEHFGVAPKEAVTDLAASMVTVHRFRLAFVQPVQVTPKLLVAVRVTAWLRRNDAVQVDSLAE